MTKEWFVCFTIWVFLKECAVGGVGADGAAAMAKGEVFAFGAIATRHKNTWAIEEFPVCMAGLEKIR